MVLLFTDLDGTLIRSYRRKFDEDVICVERHKGREFSFISSKKLELLHSLIKNDNVLVIPITTRSEAEYRRIKIPDVNFKYALIDNGARLLVNGEIDEEWEKESKKMTVTIGEPFKTIDGFLAYASKQPDKGFNLPNGVDLIQNGKKYYAIPKGLDKGSAIERFKAITDGVIIAAGDSELDEAMRGYADKFFLVTNREPDVAIEALAYTVSLV